MVGVVLAAAAIVLISFGFNNLNRWGLGLAAPNAPFNILGLSPAPIMIVIGIVLGQAFMMWTHRRQAAGKTPLLALEVIDSPQERAAVYAMFSVVALEAALNFSVPLYIQIVQGRSPLATAIAMMPFNLTVFFTAMLIVRFYDRFTPRQIGRYGFVLCTVALAVARVRGAQRLERGPRALRPRAVRHRPGLARHAAVQAVRVNTEARLRALKIGLLIMAGLALLTIIPAGRLPNYVPGEVPDEQPASKAARDEK